MVCLRKSWGSAVSAWALPEWRPAPAGAVGGLGEPARGGGAGRRRERQRGHRDWAAAVWKPEERRRPRRLEWHGARSAAPAVGYRRTVSERPRRGASIWGRKVSTGALSPLSPLPCAEQRQSLRLRHSCCWACHPGAWSAADPERGSQGHALHRIECLPTKTGKKELTRPRHGRLCAAPPQ
ncbi:hypothetical protein NDU88_003868 [Pleurodeles waltl]|uniref:Uncharacterized protein n=1 Tax=Pleurodeles waltl TaxID=8319 RepID=A0AAV7V2R7_PLEWA|nr:hypothetical protein NDU88_003868 [Pleurodeles waltl]